AEIFEGGPPGRIGRPPSESDETDGRQVDYGSIRRRTPRLHERRGLSLPAGERSLLPDWRQAGRRDSDFDPRGGADARDSVYAGTRSEARDLDWAYDERRRSPRAQRNPGAVGQRAAQRVPRISGAARRTGDCKERLDIETQCAIGRTMAERIPDLDRSGEIRSSRNLSARAV